MIGFICPVSTHIYLHTHAHTFTNFTFTFGFYVYVTVVTLLHILVVVADLVTLITRSWLRFVTARCRWRWFAFALLRTLVTLTFHAFTGSTRIYARLFYYTALLLPVLQLRWFVDLILICETFTFTHVVTLVAFAFLWLPRLLDYGYAVPPDSVYTHSCYTFCAHIRLVVDLRVIYGGWLRTHGYLLRYVYAVTHCRLFGRWITFGHIYTLHCRLHVYVDCCAFTLHLRWALLVCYVALITRFTLLLRLFHALHCFTTHVCFTFNFTTHILVYTVTVVRTHGSPHYTRLIVRLLRCVTYTRVWLRCTVLQFTLHTLERLPHVAFTVVGLRLLQITFTVTLLRLRLRWCVQLVRLRSLHGCLYRLVTFPHVTWIVYTVRLRALRWLRVLHDCCVVPLRLFTFTGCRAPVARLRLI